MARRPTSRQMLEVLGYPKNFSPTDDMRRAVEVYRFNGYSASQIAGFVGLSEEETLYHFHYELGKGQADITGRLMDNILRVAETSKDAAVLTLAFKIAQAKHPALRVPVDGSAPPLDPDKKPVSQLTREERLAEIARLTAKQAEPEEATTDE